MPYAYTVYEKYDYTALCHYIASASDSEFQQVFTKPQLNYINHYLDSDEIGVKSVLCEHEYVERFYLEDYSEYFVRCFHNYGRKTSRIHFFSTTFKECDFENFLEGKCLDKDKFEKSLEESYLGYMVIRPIPRTFIAITCLKPYKRLLLARNNKSKIIKKTNKVNLFGLSLEVESLPFQEQDKVVAACATAAMWSPNI